MNEQKAVATKTAKKERGGSSLNVFYILYTLYRYSDENHMLSVREIVQKIRESSLPDASISDDTVCRLLNGMMEELFLEGADTGELDRIKDRYGFCLIRRKTGRENLYYYDHSLSDAELRTLIDAVESYSYFATEEIAPLVNKIMSLRRAAFHGQRYIDQARHERILTDAKETLLSRIHLLLNAIRNDHSVEIGYCYYDEHKKLVLREGYPREVQPVQLLWSNGYYYLQIFHEKYEQIVNLRIDRIKDVKELDKKRTLPPKAGEAETTVDYRRSHPVMFSGECRRIHILCRLTKNNYFINSVMDAFGSDCRIQPAKDELLIKELGHGSAYFEGLGERWVELVVKATEGGTALWATQHSRDCVIISPKELKESVRQNLKQALAYYEAKENG